MPGLARLNALPDGDAVAAPARVLQRARLGTAGGRPATPSGRWMTCWPPPTPPGRPGSRMSWTRPWLVIPGSGSGACPRSPGRSRSGVGSDPGVSRRCREANAAYEDRFGHVFLICATGRGPDEILAELRRRMAHDPATELEVAAAEIGKINALRLRKLAAA